MKRLTKTIPPLSGPNPQGLKVPLKQVKLVSSGKIYGRYRQGSSKRSTSNNRD